MLLWPQRSINPNTPLAPHPIAPPAPIALPVSSTWDPRGAHLEEVILVHDAAVGQRLDDPVGQRGFAPVGDAGAKKKPNPKNPKPGDSDPKMAEREPAPGSARSTFEFRAAAARAER